MNPRSDLEPDAKPLMAAWAAEIGATMNTNRKRWRRSSRCGSSACVEVKQDRDVTSMRDSKNRAGTVLTFTAKDWTYFLTVIREGEFGTDRRETVSVFGPNGNGVSVDFTNVDQDRIEVAGTREHGMPPLVFDVAEWEAFVKGVEAGDFDA